MSRKDRDYSRKVAPDAKYSSLLIAKFINAMMWNGKRATSERLFYDALGLIEKRYNEKGEEIFQKAINNIKPVIEVRSRRVGGANYQIPTEVRPVRQDTLAVRWLVSQARSRSEKSMTEKLAAEIYDASQSRGGAVKKKEDTHKMAEANRAFAHYRW